MATELRKVGATVDEGRTGCASAADQLQRRAIDTYDDHRMAMCFSLVSLGGVRSGSTIRTACARPIRTTSTTSRDRSVE
jgi:5-enolpyruvylshikimate-3-phosphate synthase